MSGSRPGERRGGRRKGTPNRRTAALQEATAVAAAAIGAAIPDAFDGDAHAFLMAVYKDPRNDLAVRIDAAKGAIRYEKPAMASVQTEVFADLTLRQWMLELK